MEKKCYVWQDCFGGPKHYFKSKEEAEFNAKCYDPVFPVFEEDVAVFEVGKVYAVECDYMDMAGSYWIRFECVGRSDKFVKFKRVGRDEVFKCKVKEFYCDKESVYPKDYWFGINAKQVMECA